MPVRTTRVFLLGLVCGVGGQTVLATGGVRVEFTVIVFTYFELLSDFAHSLRVLSLRCYGTLPSNILLLKDTIFN